MDRSPFPFQGPLAPSEVTGRDDLRRDPAERMVERIVTALLGPRRYVQTSLLRRVTADLAVVGHATTWTILYALTSIHDLDGDIASCVPNVKASRRKHEGRVDG